MTDRRIGDWPHTMHSGYEPDASSNRVTHGRHCSCTPCRAQDWNDPGLAPCGMHPKGCPPDADAIPNSAAKLSTDELLAECNRLSRKAGEDATRNRVPTLEQIVQALRDKDCPYLGHFKIGYDAALDDVLAEWERAT